MQIFEGAKLRDVRGEVKTMNMTAKWAPLSARFIALLAIGTMGAPAPALAQVDDVNAAQQAYLNCEVGNNLGYGSFEACAQAEYQRLLQDSQWGNGESGGWKGWGEGNNPYDQNCNSAATRIRTNC